MSPLMIVIALVVLIVLIGVLYYVNKTHPAAGGDVSTPPVVTQPPVYTPPDISTPPVISQPPPVVVPPVNTGPVQTPLTPNQWNGYYDPMDPTKWIVLRRKDNQTQCFVDTKNPSQCMVLKNKIDAQDMSLGLLNLDVIAAREKIPVLYKTLTCGDEYKKYYNVTGYDQGSDHWCNMFN
jgi:hypothetical protein